MHLAPHCCYLHYRHMQRPLVHLFPFCNRLLMARLSSTPAPPPIDPGPANQESPRTTTIAWVQSVRRHKTKTFLNVNDGSSPNTLQAVCSTSSLPEGVTVGSAVSVDGRLVRRQQPSDSAADSVELHADSVRLLSAPGAGGNSNLVGAMSHSRPKRGLLRSEKGLAWRHRLPEMSSVLRLRAACKSIVHRALQSRGYLEVAL
uniref:AA_TRNA_LIGASE_II domain-containing protein n=1 Tax=Mesocestoides corti TaxID=53468 RepID=A0A5K3FR06_MESCO